jgi:protoporphyrinogen oxidase
LGDRGPARVAIIGGGLAGLAAAYDLGRDGFNVTLLEGASNAGGLASSFRLEGAPIERFYHFICRTDVDLVHLVRELGIQDKLHWRQARTSFFHNGRVYPFGTPFDLLRFAPVPLADRVRFGFSVIQSRYRSKWENLDAVSARDWLISHIGRQAYQVIWEPLLRVKFGDFADQISAAWIWHRIYRVASSRRRIWQPETLGYLEEGSSTVIQALLTEISKCNQITIRTRARVAKIEILGSQAREIQLEGGERIACDFAISTVALPVLTKIAPGLPSAYRNRLEQIKYLGVICMLLRLRHPLTRSFWINTNDPRISFNGFIEYTNLNPRPDLNGSRIVYVPFYLPVTAERFRRDDASLFEEYIQALQCVNPAFARKEVEEYYVFRENFAQAICWVGFSKLIPEHTTPIENLYVTDSAQFYPEDRTISAAIRLGRRVAALIYQATSRKEARGHTSEA